MKYYISITVFLLLIITGCEERLNKESFKDKQFINVSSDKLDDTLHNPSFIEDVWTVKLEDTDDNLIGHVKKVLVNENLLYVFDSKRSSVFIFNLNTGEYINKIDNKGKGPKEYYYIEDFYLNAQGQIIIYDTPQKKKLIFSETGEYLSNEFVNDFSLGFHNTLQYNNNEVYYKGKQGGSNQNIAEHYIIIRNPETNELSYYFNNAGEFEIKLLSIDPHLMLNRNSLFVHFPFKNVIYQFVENKFKPVYEINIDNRLTPKEVFNLKDYEVFKNEYFESTKFYHMWSCVKVSNNYFIIPIFNNKKVIGNIWIDRRSNEYFSAKQVTVNNDGINMTLPLLPRAVKGDTVIALNGFINSYFTAGPEEQYNSYYYENPTLIFYKLK